MKKLFLQLPATMIGMLATLAITTFVFTFPFQSWTLSLILPMLAISIIEQISYESIFKQNAGWRLLGFLFAMNIAAFVMGVNFCRITLSLACGIELPSEIDTITQGLMFFTIFAAMTVGTAGNPKRKK